MRTTPFKAILISLFALTLAISCAAASPVAAKATKRATPTLYIHGLQGSHKSTDKLIKMTSKHGAKKVFTINVQADGTLQTTGHYTRKSKVKHPLIQVNFENNVAPVSTQTTWLTKVLTYLKQKKHVHNVNIVAHSAGNVTVLTTMSQTTVKLPKLKHYVDIAGPFDGVVGMNDTPNRNSLDANNRPKIFTTATNSYPSYQSLIDTAKTFPKHARVLVLYGNLQDGTNSDGLVTTTSARSVNYLLQDRVKQIKNVQMNHLTHSGLHNSKKVARKIVHFLFK